MRKLMMVAVAGVLFCGLALVKADEGMCAKCALNETKSCQNVVIVTKDGKKTTYYLAHEGESKKAHSKLGFCQATKEDPIKVKVTGTCEKKDDKLVVTAEKLEKQ
jgi:hypothetical protein